MTTYAGLQTEDFDVLISDLSHQKFRLGLYLISAQIQKIQHQNNQITPFFQFRYSYGWL
jgi:hypothetical protein